MMTMLLKSILIFIFVVISISDWRTHKIPDRWNAGILLVAVLLLSLIHIYSNGDAYRDDHYRFFHDRT